MRITIIEMEAEEFALLGAAEACEAKLSTAEQVAGKTSQPDEIRLFGRKLWLEGNATLRDLVTLTMEHFCLTTADFARIIGTTPSTVSLFLDHGQCLDAVFLACTNFFGYEGSPESTQRPAKPGEQSQLVTAEACGDGTTATATFGGNII